MLNDNGMSIAPNVGALSRYFNRIRLNPRWHHAREDVETSLTKLPAGIGERIERLGPIFKESLKAYWAPGLLFEELDIAYVGVIDGHDVGALREAIGEALEADRPVVVHAKTVKGKGFAPAEDGGLEGMEKWHAAKPASIVGARARRSRRRPPRPADAGRRRSTRRSSATRSCAEAERDERVLGITAAMNSGTGLDILQKALPDRYYDVGIAEQHAVLFAAGLALQGAKPVAAIYSTFLQRGFDQIVHDVCLQKLNVVFAMDRAGLVGDDGPTHHGAFDISYLRCLPNIVADGPARRGDARAHAAHRRALRRRPDRPALPARRGRGRAAARRARADRDRPRRGPARGRARGAARLRLRRVARRWAPPSVLAAEHGIDATVADARFAKPLDAELIDALAAEHDLLVTIEENVLAGGFGAAVVEHLVDRDLARRRARAALRPAGPLRDPRQARAAARGGRPHAEQIARRGGAVLSRARAAGAAWPASARSPKETTRRRRAVSREEMDAH